MREEKIILLQGNKFELRGGMELEDNGIGDVIEGEDQRELVLFQWEDDAGLLSLRVLTTDKQTRTGMSSWGR